MRLVRFIDEGMVNHWDNISKRDVMETLQADCKEMLAYMMKKKIWFSRYYKGHNPGLRKVIPRVDRQPLDTPKYLHDMMDKIFFDKFGWRVRSSGVFTWPQDKYALHGGDPRGDAFFPIGKLQAVFDRTNDIEDLFLWVKEKWLDVRRTTKEGKNIPNFYKLGEIKDSDDPDHIEIRDRYFNIIKTELEKHYISDISKIGRANRSEVVWRCPAYYLLYIDQFREMVDEH